jgi:hypothetical protein
VQKCLSQIARVLRAVAQGKSSVGAREPEASIPLWKRVPAVVQERLLYVVQCDEYFILYSPATAQKRVLRLGGRNEPLLQSLTPAHLRSVSVYLRMQFADHSEEYRTHPALSLARFLSANYLQHDMADMQCCRHPRARLSSRCCNTSRTAATWSRRKRLGSFSLALLLLLLLLLYVSADQWWCRRKRESESPRQASRS